MRQLRRLGWTFIAVGAALTALVLAALPATATVAPPTTLTITTTKPCPGNNCQSDIHGPGIQGVRGTYVDAITGTQQTAAPFGGLWKVKISGSSTPGFAYCIHLGSDLLHDGETSATWTEHDWDTVRGALQKQLPKIAYILNANPVDGTDMSAANQLRAAAVQAAIWRFSDKFVLDPTNPPQLIAMANSIIAAAQSIGQPAAPVLAVAPSTATGQAPGEVGPFTISLTGADKATLSVDGPAGTEIRSCTTHLPVTTAANGDQICLFRTTAGTVTLQAATTAVLPSGRIFTALDNAHLARQELILANSKPVALTAHATSTWTETSTTTSTTVSPTTSTTVAPTTTSTTAPATTTTTAPASVLATQQTPPASTPPAAAAPAAAQTGTLPMTGTQPVPTAILALTFLVLGALLLGLGRPMPAFVGAVVQRPRTAWTSDIRPKLPWWLRRSRPRHPLG